MPSPGIWFVNHKPHSKSYSHVMKISELPEKWPLLHYYEYKDEICSELITYTQTHPNGVSLAQIVEFVLEFIAKQYVIDRNKRMPDKKINSIEDLNL